MARPCNVCEHPDRPSIELGLANGIGQRVLGQRYGLNQSQLSRHLVNHMDETLVQRLRVRGHRSDEELAHIRDVESKSLLDHLAYQRGRLYANGDRAAAIGDLAGERAALAEASRTSQRIGNLLGEMGAHIVNNTQINLVAMPVWHDLRTELVAAMRLMPREMRQEAMATIGGALERVEARHIPDPRAVLEHQAA